MITKCSFYLVMLLMWLRRKAVEPLALRLAGWRRAEGSSNIWVEKDTGRTLTHQFAIENVERWVRQYTAK